jgi:hypothetical protein
MESFFAARITEELKMELERETLLQTLGVIPVPLTLTYLDCVLVNHKLRACGCRECLEIHLQVLDGMSTAAMSHELPPKITAAVDQALANETRAARIAILTHVYMERVRERISSGAALDRAAANIGAMVSELDMSLPMDELKASAESIAASHSATWDVAGGGDR